MKKGVKLREDKINDLNSMPKINSKTKKYFFKETFINEFDAFLKYFKAIKKNGILLEIIREVDNMGDYCDLFSDVDRDFHEKPLNSYSDGIPTSEENKYVLHASNVLKLVDTPTKGRGFIADCAIPKDKILIYEPPAVLQVKPLCTCVGNKDTSLYRCHNCGAACKMFFTCDGCNVCIFCSRTCMLLAYTNYHRYECYGLQRHFWSMDDTDYSYLSLRMMLYGASKDFKTNPPLVQRFGNSENNYPFVYTLESNFRRFSLPRINEILHSSARNLVYLARKTNFFNGFVGKKHKENDLYLYIGGLMVKHYCQAQINTVFVKYPNLPAGFGLEVVSCTGKAICPTVALLNHSCSPNAAVIVYYDSIAVKATRTILEGEEVKICYHEVNALLTMPERQIITEELFYFTCQCYFCEYERHWDVAPYKCQLCEDGRARKIEVRDRILGYCLKCEKYFSFDCVADDFKIASICESLYKATYSIEHLSRLAECYSRIFPWNSWNLLDVYKLLYEKHVLGEDKPLEAAKFGLYSFGILEHYISKLYLPILIDKVKFVQTVVHMRKFSTLTDVTLDEFNTMKIFVEVLLDMKKDLEFYLPEQRIIFHHNILQEVHRVFKAMKI